MFTINVGTTDRILRIVGGACLIAFAVLAPDITYSWLGWWGVPMLLTAVVKFCPAYIPFGINTNANKQEAPET